MGTAKVTATIVGMTNKLAVASIEEQTHTNQSVDNADEYTEASLRTISTYVFFLYQLVGKKDNHFFLSDTSFIKKNNSFSPINFLSVVLSLFIISQ